MKESPAWTNITLAPPLPEWPDGLRGGCTIPNDGDCPSKLGLGAVCFDEATAMALDLTLAIVEVYPAECQRRIDEGWKTADKVLEKARKELDALPKPPDGGTFQDWEVALMVTGAAIIGALLGAGGYAIVQEAK